MIPLRLAAHVIHLLDRSPAIDLLGPRQVGKTTLALQIAGSRPSLYLDLESEIDLLALPGNRLWAIEVKRSFAPKLEKGFHAACADLQPQRRFVVYPGTDTFPIGPDIVAISLAALAGEVAALA
jgi:uncharacterized protein